MAVEDLSSAIVVNVREFDPNKDKESVEAVEKICEVGPSGKLSLFTDLHGDPICRVRNSPTFLMLVCYTKYITHNSDRQKLMYLVQILIPDTSTFVDLILVNHNVQTKIDSFQS
jgi:hypothetical protein